MIIIKINHSCRQLAMIANKMIQSKGGQDVNRRKTFRTKFSRPRMKNALSCSQNLFGVRYLNVKSIFKVNWRRRRDSYPNHLRPVRAGRAFSLGGYIYGFSTFAWKKFFERERYTKLSRRTYFNEIRLTGFSF